jgi:hypothetical protein
MLVFVLIRDLRNLKSKKDVTVSTKGILREGQKVAQDQSASNRVLASNNVPDCKAQIFLWHTIFFT